MNTCDITVCIPCIPIHTYKLYNCLLSIEKQTLLPFEVIIGHSQISQITEQKILNKIKKLNFKFNVIIDSVEKKCFASANRNRASKLAKGSYISYFDADDIMSIYRIEILWKIIKKYNPYAITHNRNKIVDKIPIIYNDIPIIFGKKLFDIAKKRNKKKSIDTRITHGNVTIKKEILKHIQQDESRRVGEDCIFCREILSFYGRNNNTMILLDIPLTKYIPNKQQKPDKKTKKLWELL